MLDELVGSQGFVVFTSLFELDGVLNASFTFLFYFLYIQQKKTFMQSLLNFCISLFIKQLSSINLYLCCFSVVCILIGMGSKQLILARPDGQSLVLFVLQFSVLFLLHFIRNITPQISHRSCTHCDDRLLRVSLNSCGRENVVDSQSWNLFSSSTR